MQLDFMEGIGTQKCVVSVAGVNVELDSPDTMTFSNFQAPDAVRSYFIDNLNKTISLSIIL